MNERINHLDIYSIVVRCLVTSSIRDLHSHCGHIDLASSNPAYSLMATVQRKQAPRLARPAARYWKGKAPKGVVEAESDSDGDEEAQDELALQEDGDVRIRDVEMGASGEGDEDEDEEMRIPKARVDVKGKSISVALKDVSVSKEGKVIVAGRLESGKTRMEAEEEGMLVFGSCPGGECSLRLLDSESSEEEEEEEEGAPGNEESEEVRPVEL